MDAIVPSAGLRVTLLFGLGVLACGRQDLDGFDPDGGQMNIGTAGATGAAGHVGAAGVSGVAGHAGTAGASGVAGVTGAAGVTGTAGAPATGVKGPWIFFDSFRDLNRDIFAIHTDGTGLTRITSSPSTDREPAVSPDGTMLAYSSDAGGGFELFVQSLPRGAPRQLTKLGDAEQPSWSPDGRQLVFSGKGEAYVIGVDGSGQTLVRDLHDGFQALHPVFTPDGHSILFDGQNQIHALNLDTRAETSVVHNTTTTIQHPSVSPDGHSIAFDMYCGGGPAIFVAPLADDTMYCQGTRVTQDTFGPATFPAFSPTGLIAFIHGSNNGTIAVVSVGGAPRDVTAQGHDDRDPCWAPESLLLSP